MHTEALRHQYSSKEVLVTRLYNLWHISDVLTGGGVGPPVPSTSPGCHLNVCNRVQNYECHWVNVHYLPVLKDYCISLCLLISLLSCAGCSEQLWTLLPCLSSELVSLSFALAVSGNTGWRVLGVNHLFTYSISFSAISNMIISAPSIITWDDCTLTLSWV